MPLLRTPTLIKPSISSQVSHMHSTTVATKYVTIKAWGTFPILDLPLLYYHGEANLLR